ALIDDILAVVPERDPMDEGVALRRELTEYVFRSAEYRRSHNVTMGVRESLIERGVQTLEDIDLWPVHSSAPLRSPAAWFLTNVWCPLWADTRLAVGEPAE